MTPYVAAPHLQGLTEFQMRSVDHVFDQFYSYGAQRFLVADETGLGKTRVAQGVIARAIEHLQHVGDIDRIDIVYVCSNADLAQQNIKRLNVTGQPELPFSSRLTMLAAHSSRLNQNKVDDSKPVNLVSFTPGTSFDDGNRLGMAPERAMLLLCLEAAGLQFDGWTWKAALRLFQGGVRKLDTFERRVGELRAELSKDGIDPRIVKSFHKGIRAGGSKGLLAEFERIVAGVGRKDHVPEELRESNLQLVRSLRRELARASVETLEPDLIILDEFQRFRHLLDDSDPETNPAGELAHHLFNYEAAKVLLLSATPYKPFTYAEEREDNHAKDLFATLGFLAKGRHDVSVEQIRAGLKEYREVVTAGAPAGEVITRLRGELMKLMSRAERPVLPEGSMVREVVTTAERVTADDLVGYRRLEDVAWSVAHDGDRGLVTPEYWKSAPYFINFCDGYKLGSRIDQTILTADFAATLAATQRIEAGAITRFRELDAGNARLRQLSDATVGAGWWQLLWVPPSLQYFEPSGPYAEPGAQNMTKRLVFSSWTATPSAVASVLSYEAERRAAAGTNYAEYTPDGRKGLTGRLGYSLRGDRPAEMSTLLLHWPMPELAAAADPLALVAANSGAPLGRDHIRERVEPVVRRLLRGDVAGGTDEADGDLRESYWRVVFSRPGNWPEPTYDGKPVSDQELAFDLIGASIGEVESEDTKPVNAAGLTRHVALARTALDAGPVGPDDETTAILTQVALFSPANIAYRAVARLVVAEGGVDGWTRFRAAAYLADAIRNYFSNRLDAIKVVEQAALAGAAPYWRQVLAYCAAGNLEAVLDEYLHHVAAESQGKPMNADRLCAIVEEASKAIGLRGVTYQAKDPVNPGQNLKFSPRFALRYGGRKTDAEDVRQPEVRRSFNSPFWPMVLASTSVGQEGIDFHWWCHAVFHWNTPPNPVDFEQREGRVDRYRGHAIRKNIAARHGRTVLTQFDGRNPWDRLYSSADEYRREYGDFTPGWVYPGDAKIERHVAPLLLSSDGARYQRIKQDVALYRLTFGQPRQEDMLELLRRRGIQADPEMLQNLRINLAP